MIAQAGTHLPTFHASSVDLVLLICNLCIFSKTLLICECLHLPASHACLFILTQAQKFVIVRSHMCVCVCVVVLVWVLRSDCQGLMQLHIIHRLD